LGWIGAQEIHRGNVIDLLDASLGEGGPPGADSAPQTQTLALCCGPKPMMAAAAAWCAARGIELRVSLEERMGCGYGACAGCTCRTRPVSGKPSSGPTIAGPDGTVKKKICAHGPVFWGDEVVWDA
jgi:dihydroorotate dehydrogenase electron transfer subunit